MMIPEEDLKKMIGDKEYYLKMNRAHAYPFNWAAGFFTVAWMIYRRMYGYAFAIPTLIFISYIIFTMISYFIGFGSELLIDFLGIYLFFVGNIVIGTYANQIYFRFLKKAYERKNLKPSFRISLFATLWIGIWIFLIIILSFMVAGYAKAGILPTS